MKRKLFTTLAAISLLLCVATVVLWLRTQYEGIAWGYGVRTGPNEGYNHTLAYSEFDRLFLCIYDGELPIAAQRENFGFGVYHPEDNRWVPPDSNRRFRWFIHRRGGYASDTAVDVGVPYWFITLLLAILPVNWIVSIARGMRRARYENGHCPACGYDLRATPERCPECGLLNSNAAAEKMRSAETDAEKIC